MKYIIANWKTRKTLAESTSWLKTFLSLLENNNEVKSKLEKDEIKVIIAPASPFIVPLSQIISSMKNLALASQDISQFEEGSFTGEVTARMLEGIVSYALLGHSERRTNNHETDEIVNKKVQLARKHNISSIVCVQGVESKIPQEVSIVAYEPTDAIGTGNNQKVEDVISVKKKLTLPASTPFLYGGSVNDSNIDSYLTSSEIDGLLVGTSSLDPEEFFKLLTRV